VRKPQASIAWHLYFHESGVAIIDRLRAGDGKPECPRQQCGLGGWPKPHLFCACGADTRVRALLTPLDPWPFRRYDVGGQSLP